MAEVRRRTRTRDVHLHPSEGSSIHLKNMIGNNNFSTVSLKQLTMPRSFFIPELKWKLTNIADDISSTDGLPN